VTLLKADLQRIYQPLPNVGPGYKPIDHYKDHQRKYRAGNHQAKWRSMVCPAANKRVKPPLHRLIMWAVIV